MKKRWLSFLLAICMILGLCPVDVFASNFEDEETAWVSTYEDLVAALASETMERIYISSFAEEEVTFQWPYEGAVLDLKPANRFCEIWMGNMDWYIPENVTVNAYETLFIPNDSTEIIIDGVWNVMDNDSAGSPSIGGVGGRDEFGNMINYGTVIVNGTMAISSELWSSQFVSCDDFIVNGTLITGADGFNIINNIVLGDGAVIKGDETVRFEGNVISQGTAYIEAESYFGVANGDEITISGDLEVGFFNVTGPVHIAEGSVVYTNRLSSSRSLRIDGELIIEATNSGSSISAPVTLGENGALSVMYDTQLHKYDTGCIQGDGTLKVYGMVSTYDEANIMNEPMVFGKWMADGDPEEGIADSVTIWRNWQVDCEHSLSDVLTVDATCSTDGYHYKVCEKDCGYVVWMEWLRRTGEHDIIAYQQYSKDNIVQICGSCGSSLYLYIYCEDQAYTGEPIEEARLMGEWCGDYPEITYTNNVEVGVGTASFSAGGYTASFEFEIIDCEGHTGGEATCSQRAICDLCGCAYGDYAEHDVYERCGSEPYCRNCGEILGPVIRHVYDVWDLQFDEYTHYYICELCGNEVPEDLISAELGYEPTYGHIYADHTSCEDPIVCLVCGYVSSEAHEHIGHATCIEPATCYCCGQVFGNPGAHEIVEDATCISLAYCWLCEQFVGEYADHIPDDPKIENVVDATCATEGSYVKVTYCQICSAEISREEVIVEKLPHTEAPIPAVDATCSATGLTEGMQCTVCGEITKAQEMVEMLPHSEESVPGKEATCAETGLTEGKKCSVCGEILVEQEVLATTDHNEEVIPGKAATCTETGLTDGAKCADCGKILVEQAVIELADHTEEIIPAKDATCSETGLTEGKKCSVCGEILEAQKTVEKTAHAEEIIPGKDATCSETGLTEGKKCPVCGEVLVAQEIVEKKAHTEQVVAGKDATCAESGLTDGIKCAVCDTVLAKQDEIEKLPHTEEVISGKAASCTEEGLTEGKKCSVCGEILVAQEVIEKLAHTEDVIPGYAATCTESGLSDGKKCTVCDAVLAEQVVIDPLPHAEVVIAGKAATCTEDGLSDGAVCSVCEKILKEQVVIEALGHEEEAIPAVDSTCTATGLTEGKKCSVCGEILVAQKVVEKLAHTEEVIPGKDATEEETGLTEGKKCSVCGEILVAQEIIDKLPPSHVHAYESDVVAATCTEAGYTVYTCECGDSYVGDETKATGHTFGEWKTTTLPKIGQQGVMTRTCHCGEAETKLLAPLSESFTDVKKGDWFENEVAWAYTNQITTGATETAFNPTGECTRAQVVTFLWRAAGKPEPTSTVNPFKDVVEGQYYYDAVLWAVENNITNGMDATTFGTDVSCNRGQVVTFLWRTAGKPNAESAENPFADVPSNEYYAEAVLWAVENEITKGMSDTTFVPEGEAGICNRAQIVTFLYRYINQ